MANGFVGSGRTERLRIPPRPDLRLKKRKRLEETFHDFIHRLREFLRAFLSRVKVTAIEIRGFANSLLAINDKPWIFFFLIKCRRYLTDIAY